jgi:hypothetical protein
MSFQRSFPLFVVYAQTQLLLLTLLLVLLPFLPLLKKKLLEYL